MNEKKLGTEKETNMYLHIIYIFIDYIEIRICMSNRESVKKFSKSNCIKSLQGQQFLAKKIQFRCKNKGIILCEFHTGNFIFI